MNTDHYSNKIYVSLFSAQQNDLVKALDKLIFLGFKNIELCGGTRYRKDYEEILIQYQKKFNLNYLVHNYFPAPLTPFSLNLASDNKQIITNSIELIKKAIDLCVKIKSKRYSFHAGFRLSPQPTELGEKLVKRELLNKKVAWEIFSNNVEIIKKYSNEKGVDIFIENNVIGEKNKKSFLENPFLFTDSSELCSIENLVNGNILLDVGHLKVSCKNLNLNFEDEFCKISKKCKYYHISNNNGLEDQNAHILYDDDIFKILKKTNYSDIDTCYTLEVYQGDEYLVNSYKNLVKAVG